MRRGHPGIGGWRNENPRHFRSRNAGPEHSRPPRAFSFLDTSRYPPPEPRSHRSHPPFNHHGYLDSQGPFDHHDRDYRGRSTNHRHDRSHHQDSRQMPSLQNPRHNVLDTPNPYNDKPNFYEDVNVPELIRVNSMGDIDLRRPMNVPQKKDFLQRQPWTNPPQENNRYYYDKRNVHDHYLYPSNVDGNRISALDSSGHRPPSSDHYDTTSRSSTERNDVFSHSVDDTVDIIRKRLLNRNDPQVVSMDQPPNHNFSNEENKKNRRISYQNDQHEQTTKRKVPQQQVQQHINIKTDCDKLKNKIVHTFFKMNKRGMHKLINDPSSSAKFEYAISSFILESQNSLNRHQRSAAEKSLYKSSTDFIHSDQNTAYEDTFMKQMQCILDPQDTILLEDIKPLVMAEMTRVLKLDDAEHHLDADNPGDFQRRDQHQQHDYNASDISYENFPQNLYLENLGFEVSENILNNDDDEVDVKYDFNNQTDYQESKPLYERRPTRRMSDHSQDRRLSFENRQHIRKSFDKITEDKSNEPLPLFTSNTELLSDDDDPFAELDKQYHVAVDHNFLENDDLSNTDQIVASSSESPVLQTDTIPHLQTPNENLLEVKKEIDDQLQNIAKSPLKLFSPAWTDPILNSCSESQELLQNLDSTKTKTEQSPTPNNEEFTATNNLSKPEDYLNKTKNQKQNNDYMQPTTKSSTRSSTRKRSMDQKPSHRKEKRKKSESSPIHNKTLDKFVTVSDNRAPKVVDGCSKTIQSSGRSKNETKDDRNCKKSKCADKNDSHKYVKRKELQKKSRDKEKEPHTKNINNSTSNSLTSPKDSNNVAIHSETASKADAKTKLKPIDMFIGQPKKVAVHQAHRNTAISAVCTDPKPAEEVKAKQEVPSPRKINKKCTTAPVCKKSNTKETQTIQSKLIARFSQTEKIKMVSKAIQTDLPVCSERPKLKSNDSFERMKEIDLEIQVLLQEKFKLYSSIEAKDTNQSSVQTLGMSVFNVPLETNHDENETDNALCEDTIVDQFTSIPVEELEQIAFESVQDENIEVQKSDKKSRHARLELKRKHSESPSSKAPRRVNRRAKGPNISLIEQIITDDRPLEDIISLEDLENLERQPSRVRKRSTKVQSLPKRKPTKKAKTKGVEDATSLNLKECSVVLLREDFSYYCRAMSVETESTDVQSSEDVVSVVSRPKPVEVQLAVKPPDLECPGLSEGHGHKLEVIEDSVDSDLQFDMLDVSEDIVIGESPEKSEDRDANVRVSVPISDEIIILDNSQSSMEDGTTSEPCQEENECRMFDYSTDENLRRDAVLVSGHADAVLAIECIDNEFIAACLDGNVYHFGSDGRLVSTLRGSNLAVTCLTIVREPHGTTVYTGSLDSRIRYYDLETGLEKGPECNVLSPIQTMDRAWDTVFVGTRTGFVLQFECKNNMLIPVSTVKFSEQSILALRALKEGPRKVLLVAARSENVTIKDAQSGLLLRTLQGPKMTVYTLLFEDGKVYCGTSTQQIHVFDYASGCHVGAHSGGKGAVCLRATGGLVFAGCYDGCVYVFREGQPRPLAQLRGPSLMLLSLAVHGSRLIAGYKDRSLYIWKIPHVILQEMIL